MFFRHPFLPALLAAVLTAPLASAADLVVHVENATSAPVEDAIVYALPTAPVPPAPGLKYIIDQVDRQFVPRVNVVQTGTSISFPNSDNIRHSVYSFSAPKIFALKLYAGKSADPVVFDKPGLVVLGCDIHDLMVSWLMVVDTPYYAHTDHTGTATLSKLPAGDYTLRTWHSPMREEQQTSDAVHVEAGAGSSSRTVRISVPLDSPEHATKSP